jgi:hypothetical protein
MLVRSNLSKALLHHKYAYRKADEVSERRLRTQARLLIDRIRDSDQALEVQLGYQLLSGRRVALDLLTYGARYEDGLEVETNGRIRLRISHNDLTGPLKSLLAQDERTPPLIDVAEAGASALADAEEIFFRACGVLQSEYSNSSTTSPRKKRAGFQACPGKKSSRC